MHSNNIFRSQRRILVNHDALFDAAVDIARHAAYPISPFSNNSRNTTDIGSVHSRSGEDGAEEAAHNGNDNTQRPWHRYDVSDLRLEGMSFAQQVEALRRTDVLVAQYGTGTEIGRRVRRGKD